MLKYSRNAVLSLLIVAVCYSNAQSYQVCQTSGGNDLKWSFLPVTYLINASGGPSGSISAITAGMQEWTDVSTSQFAFLYGGTTTSTAYGVNDGTNTVTFGPLGSGILAQNTYWFYSFGMIIDSDIRFNTSYSWNTDGNPADYDVQNIGTHEHGHSLCLLDLYGGGDSSKTMYGYGYEGETKKRSLDQDDIDGITYLYPCGLPVRVVGTSTDYYATIQAAYDDAGDGEIIQVRSGVYGESIYIDDLSNKEVLLEGGYDCSFVSLAGEIEVDYMEISHGALTISGMVTID
jgi:hypothetical protein